MIISKIQGGAGGSGGGQSIADATIALDNNSFTYDGTLKTKTVTSVVYNGVTLIEGTDYKVVGNTAVEAGTHSLLVVGIGSYDGKAAKNWSIAQATGVVTLSDAEVLLDRDVLEYQVTITANSTGTITLSGVDSNIATAVLNGNTITITAVDNGSYTFTVNVAADNNHPSASTTCNISVSLVYIYGVSWDGTSTTAWTRTDDAANFIDPAPYMSGATGYGSPFDAKMPWKGMTIVEDSEAGTMVQIPKFWYQIGYNNSSATDTSSGGMYIKIANKEVEGFSVSPAHMDRGDGKGERDIVYIGRYHCGATAYKSVSGQKPKVSIVRSTARSNIHNLGATIWQCDWAMRFTLFLLYLVEFANWNSQSKIGYGCSLTSSKSSAVFNMGYTDSMPYHTGTTQTSRTYGGTQYRNIEGLWDNCGDWIDGCYNSSSGLSIIKNPSSFSDSSNGTAVGTPISGYPTAFSVKNVSGTFPLFIPTASSGGSGTYSCDSWAFDSSNACVFSGGNYSQNAMYGLFHWDDMGWQYNTNAVGCRSIKLP